MDKKNKVLCSTGAFIGRVNNRDHKLIVENASKINCDGFELMMYSTGWIERIDEIVSDLCESKINFVSMHMNKNIGELISRNENGDIDEAIRIFEANCKVASELNIKLLVLHLWGGHPSDKHIDVNLKIYENLLDISNKYGLLLTVENIVCNTYNALIHMKKLHEMYLGNIKFTIDTRQAEFHKLLDETCNSNFLWDNNLVSHIHISDYKGGYMEWEKLNPVLAPGQGNIDFDKFFEFLKSVNYSKTLTLESPVMSENGIDIEKLNKSLAFIYDRI